MDNKILWELSKVDMLPSDHTNYLFKLKEQYHFFPRTIYDIGSCALIFARAKPCSILKDFVHIET